MDDPHILLRRPTHDYGGSHSVLLSDGSYRTRLDELLQPFVGDIPSKSTADNQSRRSTMITPQKYSEGFSKFEKLVSDKISAYIKKPTEENVHDLRTSIRRFLTVANILPKKIREKKESKKALSEYEKLLRLNTKVRDIDIILSKLPKHGDDPDYSKVTQQLTMMRTSSIKKARRFALSIQDLRENTIKVSDLSSKSVQKRFKKTASSLAEQLRKHLEIVVKEPENYTELHKLREDSRRLRFTLEMDDTPQTSRLVPVLETWQDLLGKIRDSDIFVSRFKHEMAGPKMAQVIGQEKSERNENYEKFMEIAKESPKFSVG